MLIATLACIVGIVVENLKWPQDRSHAKNRFLETESLGEKTGLLVGLVLSHSVVRWLISLAVAAVVVLAVFQSPALQQSLKQAAETGRLNYWRLDALTGSVIAVLMTVLSLAARRLGQ